MGYSRISTKGAPNTFAPLGVMIDIDAPPLKIPAAP
jgi:hypothetical protein